MSVDIYAETAEDGISLAELELYHLLMAYRASVGLPAIPLSRALSITAGRHALDTLENIGGYLVGEPGENKAHGWSDAPYDGRDPATLASMWTAPQRLGTGYEAAGYEISVGYLGAGGFTQTMTPVMALSGWQGSPGHNAVILNQAPWDRADLSWNAIGIGIYLGVSHVWFGSVSDPAGPTINGGAGNDDIVGSTAGEIITGGGGIDMLTGGGGADIFRDTAAGLNGDTITDFAADDRIQIADAVLAGFSFALSGTTLSFSGGTLTLPGLPSGHRFAATEAAAGGVELRLVPDRPGGIAGNGRSGDFDGDGRDDILWRSDSGQLSNWLGRPDGGFLINDANAFTAVPTSWQVAGAGDFDGDGRDDILWRSDSGQLSDWLGRPDGGFLVNDAVALTQVSLDWRVVSVGDFDGDGRDDILWRSDTGQLSNWLGRPDGGFLVNDANAFTAVPTSWQVAGTGDFDGDGRDDILWRSDTGQLSNWLGRPDGGFLVNDANAFTAVPTSWQVVGTGDFDGDGRDDILWRSDTGQLSNWLGRPDGGFTGNDAVALTQVSLDWRVVGVGDFDGDGRDDILWRHVDGTLSDWLATANGGFAPNDANAMVHVPTNWDVQLFDSFAA